MPTPCKCIFFEEDLKSQENQYMAQIIANKDGGNRAMRRKKR